MKDPKCENYRSFVIPGVAEWQPLFIMEDQQEKSVSDIDIQDIVWDPMIDYIAEELFELLSPKRPVRLSRFLLLKEEGEVVILENSTKTMRYEVQGKDTPILRDMIRKHCIDELNKTLAGVYRHDEKALIYLKRLLLDYVRAGVRGVEKVEPQERRMM